MSELVETLQTSDENTSSIPLCTFISPSDVQLQMETATGGAGGRSVIAKHDINVRSVVLSNLPPAHMLFTRYWGSRCCYCMNSKDSSETFQLSRCSKCQKATYCSRGCQAKDWNQHKLECTHLKSMWDNFLPQILDEMLMLMRAISVENQAKKASKPSDNTTTHTPDHRTCHISAYNYHGSTRNTISCGLHHVENLYFEPKLSFYKNSFYQRNLRTIANYTNKPQEYVTRLLNQFNCNNFGIVDDLMNCIGMGVYPNIALLNHSCSPNTILRYLFTSDGPVTEVVAIRPILAGEEITHSYTDCTNPKFLRQQSLSEIYQFNCHCKLCDYQLKDSSVDYMNEIYSFIKEDPDLLQPLQLRDFLKQLRVRSTVQPCDLYYDINTFLTQTLTSKKSWNEKEMSQRIDTLYEEVYYGNCKNEEEEKKAIDELMNILQQFYSLYYGPFHYELYRLRCKLLTLLVLVGDGKRAYDVCCQVVSYLTLSLINMPSHPLLGIQLFTLGDLAQSIQPSLANEYYRWTFEILSVCYDEFNPLRQKLLPFL